MIRCAIVLVSRINLCFFVYLSSSFFIVCVLLHVVDVLQEQRSGGGIACCHCGFSGPMSSVLSIQKFSIRRYTHFQSYLHLRIQLRSDCGLKVCT